MSFVCKKPKFAIIGTSCSGKTTLAFEILSKLKRLGVLADGVLQQDRRFTFEIEKIEYEEEAQYWFVMNQITKEIELSLRDDVEVLISDRSVLDFYAYYITMYGFNEQFEQTVAGWCKTYKALYYLKPLTYQPDKKRPTDEFRLKVDSKLESMVRSLEGHLPIKTISRDEIYSDILKNINRILTEDELKMIPKVLGQKCLLGGSYGFNRQTKFSDVDIYIVGDQHTVRKDLQEKLKHIFGVDFEVFQVSDLEWNFLLSHAKFKFMNNI